MEPFKIELEADGLVFTRPDGSPVNPSVVTLAFRRILKITGLKNIRIHVPPDSAWCFLSEQR